MTIRQCDRLSEAISHLGVASIIGSAGDAVITGSRYAIDAIGLGLGLYLLWMTFILTGRIPSDRVKI